MDDGSRHTFHAPWEAADFTPRLVAAVGQALDLDGTAEIGHHWRTAAVAWLATIAELPPAEAERVFLAGLLHDAGAADRTRHLIHDLLAFPVSDARHADLGILLHPARSAELAGRVPVLSVLAPLIVQHHECHDGSGYPAALAGDAILPGASVLRAADLFDLIARENPAAATPDGARTALLPFEGNELPPGMAGRIAGAVEAAGAGRLVRPDGIREVIGQIHLTLAGCGNDAGRTRFDSRFSVDLFLASAGAPVGSARGRPADRDGLDLAGVAAVIGEAAGLEPDEQRDLVWAARFADLGALGVLRTIQPKGRALEPHEAEALARHPQIGAGLLGEVPGMEAAARIVLHHHENFDGSGYPGRVAAGAICRGGRILRIADSVVAMAVARPNRRRRDWTAAAVELRRNAGTLYDPDLVEAGLAALGEA